MENFRTYNLAVDFYRQTRALALKGHLLDQLKRAASSIALNLAEGRGRETLRDQKHFFIMARGSVRECQAIFEIEGLKGTAAWTTLDNLGAHIYRLIERAR